MLDEIWSLLFMHAHAIMCKITVENKVPDTSHLIGLGNLRQECFSPVNCRPNINYIIQKIYECCLTILLDLTKHLFISNLYHFNTSIHSFRIDQELGKDNPYIQHWSPCSFCKFQGIQEKQVDRVFSIFKAYIQISAVHITDIILNYYIGRHHHT